MTKTRPRSCPGCRRHVPDHARICRACYTIVPQAAAGRGADAASTRTKSSAVLKRTAQVTALAGLAWFFGIFGDHETSSAGAAPVQMAAMRDSVGSLLGSAPHTTAKSLSGGAGLGATGENSIRPLSRQAGTCSLKQALRNSGRQPLSRVDFKVAFLDAGGRALSEAVSVTMRVDLPAQAEQNVDLQLACPPAAVGARVSLPESGTGAGPASAVTLIPQPPARDAGPAEVAVDAEPEFCPSGEQCDLEVRIDGGGAASFRVRRDAEAPGLLVSDDPILTAHLLGGGTAALDLGEDPRAPDIVLTRLHVRQAEQPGIFARWFANFL